MSNLQLIFFKKIIFLLIFIGGQQVYSQKKGGIINYKVVRNSANLKAATDKDFTNFQSTMLNIAEGFTFQLTFNQNKSRFSIVKDLVNGTDDFNSKMTQYILRGNSEFYTYLTDSVLIESRDLYGDILIFEKKIDEDDWTFVNESKKIGDYLCYAALGTKYGIDKDKNITQTPIKVWYCPEIPFRYGPFESVNLPGVVLEYELGKFKWIATDITFSDEILEIQNHPAGKKMTEEKLDEILRNRSGN